jgi:hypothetical protein
VGPPHYNTIHRLLTNPVYAGAYVFGRTGSRVRFEEGRKVITRGVARRRDEWEVLIRDHHDGYISWEEYERNQRTIAGNANMKGAIVRLDNNKYSVASRAVGRPVDVIGISLDLDGRPKLIQTAMATRLMR